MTAKQSGPDAPAKLGAPVWLMMARIREGDFPLPSTLSILNPLLFAVRDMLLALGIYLN